jgi:protein-S-isoprenylcysteine O-methyltransferase Ste14
MLYLPFELKAIVFAVTSLGIIWVSRTSLCHLRAHGFYRFFAWEAILVLFLLNVDGWFYEPFSLQQIIAWSLLIVSLFLVIHAIQLLRMIGKPDDTRVDPSLLGIEKTTELVKAGAYRYIRHPLYSSLLFLTWGIFFKNPSALGLLLAMISTTALTLTAKMEETENIRFWGAAYRDYMNETKMFVPFLF